MEKKNTLVIRSKYLVSSHDPCVHPGLLLSCRTKCSQRHPGRAAARGGDELGGRKGLRWKFSKDESARRQQQDERKKKRKEEEREKNGANSRNVVPGGYRGREGRKEGQPRHVDRERRSIISQHQANEKEEKREGEKKRGFE